eukprot:scaffold1618_cov196-Alexandrium_tamarense.AAC.7
MYNSTCKSFIPRTSTLQQSNVGTLRQRQVRRNDEKSSSKKRDIRKQEKEDEKAAAATTIIDVADIAPAAEETTSSSAEKERSNAKELRQQRAADKAFEATLKNNIDIAEIIEEEADEALAVEEEMLSLNTSTTSNRKKKRQGKAEGKGKIRGEELAAKATKPIAADRVKKNDHKKNDRKNDGNKKTNAAESKKRNGGKTRGENKRRNGDLKTRGKNKIGVHIFGGADTKKNSSTSMAARTAESGVSLAGKAGKM